MTCVIFNPTARGDKARRFRSRLSELGPGIQLIPTAGPDTAPEQAATAVEAGCTTLVAAGGDGTVNQVLNGLVAARDGRAAPRLGVGRAGGHGVERRGGRLSRDGAPCAGRE